MANYISGIWRFKGTSYYHPSGFDYFKESVNFTANGYSFTGIAFYDIATEVMVSYVKEDGTELEVMWYVGDVVPGAALTEYYTVDFGTTPQNVSSEFITFMTAMAVPMEEINGMWEFNETLEFNTLYPLDDDAVNFVYDCKNDLYTSFNRLYFDVGGGSYNAMSYVVYGQSGQIVYTTSSKWNSQEYRYIQFGEKQYVPAKFKTWLQKNAKRLGDYAIEAGDHCFKLDIYNELKETFGHNINIPFTFKTPEGSILDCYEMFLGICDYTDNPSLWYLSPAGSWEAYEYSDIDSTKFRALGWRTKYHDRLDGSF